MLRKSSRVLWFSEVDDSEIGLVGKAGINISELARSGFPVPNGFIISSHAYFALIRENNLAQKITDLLSTASYERPESIAQVSTHIQDLILKATISEDLVTEIYSAYKRLSHLFFDTYVSVRSSITAEDLSGLHIIEPFSTYQDIKGEANLILKIKKVWASLFEPGPILFRHQNRIDHFRIGIAVIVSKMVQSDYSGTIYTIDPNTNDKSKLIIESIYGHEEILQKKGKIIPDHYEIRKSDLEILSKDISRQEIFLKKTETEKILTSVPKNYREKQKLLHNQIIDLAIIGKKIEKYYFFPQKIDWVLEKRKIYITQTSPITTVSKTVLKPEDLNPTEKLQLLIKGVPASPGIAVGKIKLITEEKDMEKINNGDVIVCNDIFAAFHPALKKAVAIITDHGGLTSHPAIISREFGIPAIVGTKKATKLFKQGMVVTVNGTKGEVYLGSVHINQHDDNSIGKINTLKTATKIYINLSEPELAEKMARKNVDGIGLLRAEAMMMEIGVHPKKVIEDGKTFAYSKQLAEKIAKFCKAFHSKPVVYRTSDFKTNEYARLGEGSAYEKKELNPLLGYHGAYRNIHDPEIFKLEIEAIKIVINSMGLNNLWMMIPFCRSVKELVEIKRIMSINGLHRSSTFKIWMMVEIPANVILLDQFIKVGIDGVTIGSNDLTSLILGTDYNNVEMASEFDERNPAILWAFEQTIKKANAHQISSSICGHAASLYPDLLEKLVRFGISSISVSPDMAENTRTKVFEIERDIIINKYYGKN